MKRFLLLFFLVPKLAFGAYTEFYLQNGGSNLNACSTTNNTALYTSASGNWVQSTRVFTPTDGINPVTAGVTTGMWMSVYLNAASVGVYIGRVSAVTNAVNGTITIDSAANVGSAPSNSTGGITVKVGGACQGPNAGSAYPLLGGNGFTAMKNASSDMPRLNFKNDQTYSISTGISVTVAPLVLQGYSSSVGDGGRAIIDGSTNAIKLLAMTGTGSPLVADFIFVSTASSGSLDIASDTNSTTWFRCVFHGARGNGLLLSGAASVAIECEAYDNNKSNSASKGGFALGLGGASCYRCISHDNTGSNTAGFAMSYGATAGVQLLQNCIADTNGGKGVNLSSGANGSRAMISACEIYNNGSDGIAIATGTSTMTFYIENTNLIKNTGAGINVTSTNGNYSGFIFNCGYGAGTQANGSADTLGALVSSGAVTYPSNAVPWVDGPNGDFRINLPEANWAGRGAFTETASSYAGTVGFPDIGAAQSKTGPGGTFNKETSHASSY